MGKVAVGLSGGVDSAVAAALLIDQGYEVTGVFLECWNEPGCRTDQDRKDALAIALKLSIPFEVLDFRREYKERVMEYFVSEYEAGRTPNPDTVCNREIKFGMFYEWGMENGFDYIATGHYARVVRVEEMLRQSGSSHRSRSAQHDKLALKSLASLSNESGYLLVRGVDEKKDQSYFLYQLRPGQLGKILFPIGGMEKTEVRKEAKKRGLDVWEKPDSQGVCFMGEVKVTGFLKGKIERREGDVVWRLSDEQVRKVKGQRSKLKITSQNSRFLDKGWLVVGKHDGVSFKTVGQRIGVGLDQGLIARLCKLGVLDLDPTNLPALYVVGKDVEMNVLVIGLEEDLERSEFEVGDINVLDSRFMNHDSGITDCYVRIRNLGEIVSARIQIENSDREKISVKTNKPLRGVAEGQACVFYDNKSIEAVVLGGGVIVG